MRGTRHTAVIALAALFAAGCSSDTAGHGRAGGSGRLVNEIQIVAIALGGKPSGHDPSSTHVYVDPRYCRIVDVERRGPCAVRPIPPSVRQGVLKVVGPAYRFVTRAPSPTRTRIGVSLGAPVVSGDTATIAVDSTCGPLCGSGSTIHLRRDAGRWHEVGPRTTDWIS